MNAVVIGNGIAGISAALAFRELNQTATISVIADETELFFARTALMYVFMRGMRFQDIIVNNAAFYRTRDIQLVHATARRVDFKAQRVYLDENRTIDYDTLLLAPGAQGRRLGIPGEYLDGVQFFTSKKDLDCLEARAAKGITRAVIVGGGLIGVELAEMLIARHIPVTLLARESLYFASVLPPEEARMVSEEIRSHGVDLRLDTSAHAIHGEAGCVQSVETSTRERIDCSFVGCTIGVEPRLALVKNSAVQSRRGILTDRYLQTNVKNVFAAGDAAEIEIAKGTYLLEQLWYSGKRQGALAGYNMAAALDNQALRAYETAPAYNSAKFFSLEYQSYGHIPRTAYGADSIFWQDERHKRSIRIAFENAKGDKLLTGIATLGIRLRQETCEAWIKERAPLANVLEKLGEASFEPEFARRFERELRASSV